MPSTPSRLSATTRKPETAPPRSETLMASLTLRWAAAAVRRLAWTAMYMPMKPARPEQNAPTRKATAVRIPCAGSLASPPISTPMIRAATSASSEMVRYWRFRKAIAPSKIRAATSCIAFVPVSCERTSRASQAANRTAIIPASNTTGQNSIGTCVPPTFPTTYAQAAVKLSGMAADRAERGSSGRPRTVTLHTLRAEFTTREGGRKPRGRPCTRLALAWRSPGAFSGKSVTEVQPTRPVQKSGLSAEDLELEAKDWGVAARALGCS